VSGLGASWAWTAAGQRGKRKGRRRGATVRRAEHGSSQAPAAFNAPPIGLEPADARKVKNALKAIRRERRA